MPTPSTLVLLVLAALLAGFVDAVAGGGGLITLPALLLGLPALPLTTILGTNKVVAFTGTSVAATQFARSRLLPWSELAGPLLGAMLGAAAGVGAAYLLQGRAETLMRPVMLGALVLLLVFALAKPDLGRHHAPRFGLAHQRGLALGISITLGFYDGIFGPGTGSLLIFLFVSVLGFDFLRASALAKTANWSSNATAMALFLYRGSWVAPVALAMAFGNGLGGFLGARMALRKGARWVRSIFLGVVSLLILRLAWQILH